MFKSIPVIIEEFNDKYKIRNVIEKTVGVKIEGKGLICPFHKTENKYSATIDDGRNIFTCWENKCAIGLTPWNFIKKYYNLNGFKEVAEKINELFDENIGIFKKEEQQEDDFNVIYKVNKHLSEVKDNLLNDLTNKNKLLLNANTGMGKTFGINEIFKNDPFVDDYVIALAPTRTIAEQFSKEYPMFKLFYGNDTELPNSKHIICTYHKIHLLNEIFDRISGFKAINQEFPLTYSVVLDECHELMSNRILLGEKARMIEDFIQNATRSIVMSANTKYFYKAYKEKGIFNYYSCVDLKEKVYNAELFTIKRVSAKEKILFNQVIKTIQEKLQRFDKVIFFEDNIEKLKAYSEKLNSLGIENIVINSQDREDDEVKSAYNQITKNSKLTKRVTLVTSIISCGVNIKNEKVATIVKQDRNQFDIEKIEQSLARVRTFSNDLTLILTKRKEPVEIKTKSYYEHFIYGAFKEAESVAYNFNIETMALHGEKLTEKEFNRLWNNYKNNEAYSKTKSMLYVKNAVLKIDEIAVCEYARLKYQRSNYYDDEFIKKELSRVKAKRIIIDEPIEEEEIEIKEALEGNFIEDLKNLLKDSEQLLEFYQLLTKEMKSSELQKMKPFYDLYNQNKLYKEMVKNIRECILPNLDDKEFSIPTIIGMIIEIYTKDIKRKERIEAVKNIYRVEILNKLLPIGSTNEELKLTGDIVYYLVRKNYDNFIENRHQINKTTFEWTFTELVKIRKLTLAEEKEKKLIYVDELGKKTTDKVLIEEIESCTKSIYDITNRNYISKLN